MNQGQELFASADGTFRLVFVQARGDIGNYRECAAWLGAVKGIVERWQQANRSGLVVRFTGGAAFEAEISSGMERDMTGSIGVTSLIIALLFWIAHRRLAPMLWLLTLLGIILPFYSIIDMIETSLNVWSDACVAKIVDVKAKQDAEAPALVACQEAS